LRLGLLTDVPYARVGRVSGLGLRLDHVIVRSAEPETTLNALVDAGLPLLSAVQPIAGGAMRSGLVRAVPLDIEVLAFGEPAPAQPQGFGLGFTAPGRDLMQISAELRGRGLPTSGVVRSRAVADRANERGWSVIQVAGLLPNPFPARHIARAPGFVERASVPLVSALIRVPAIAERAMRQAGESMIVVTAYDFDVETWRKTVPAGPQVVEVVLGVGDRLHRWEALGPLEGPRLVLTPDGPTGVQRVTLAGGDWQPGRPAATIGALTLAPGA
jgi:hypothetical protein